MSDEKKNDFENVHGTKQWFSNLEKLTKRVEQSDPFVASDDVEPETAPEPAPEPVVTPEPVEPEKPADDEPEVSQAQFIKMAKHYRKVNGVAYSVAEKALRDDPELFEEYKNLKKW